MNLSRISKLIAHIIGLCVLAVANGVIVGKDAVIVTAVVGLLTAIGVYQAPANTSGPTSPPS